MYQLGNGVGRRAWGCLWRPDAQSRAAGHLAGIEERAFPTHDVEMVAEDLFLRIVAGDQDAERIVEEGVAEQSSERRA